MQDKTRTPAGIDPLTTLPSWGAIVDAADAEFNRSRRAGLPLSVALVEVDFLGGLRQAHGEPVGEVVLQHVAATFRKRMRKAEYIGRYCDDGFLLIFPEASLDEAWQATERLADLVGHSPLGWHDRLLVVTVSAGVAATPTGTVKELLARASTALDAARNAGRNCVRFAGGDPDAPSIGWAS